MNNKIEEKFKWETTGDKDDREFLAGLVQRTKLIYGDIKPAKYDLNNFDKDLDKLLKKFVKDSDSYFKAQDDRNLGKTNKVHGEWMKAAQKVFRHVTTNTAWRGQLNSFTRNLSTIWQVHMEAEAGRTGNRGYKVFKRQKFQKSLQHFEQVKLYEQFVNERFNSKRAAKELEALGFNNVDGRGGEISVETEKMDNPFGHDAAFTFFWNGKDVWAEAEDGSYVEQTQEIETVEQFADCIQFGEGWS